MTKVSSKKAARAGASASASSPVVAVRHRDIPEKTRILLAVRSGGRCEFAGCNMYTFEHPLTLVEGNFSESAHIVAFSQKGPRGREGKRPKGIHVIENLMHLCFECHKLIDDRPADYPRAVLESYKAAHEARIRHLTGLGPDLQTTVLQLKALVAGQAVDIPIAHVYEAVAPRWPTDRRGVVIDLTSIPFDSDAFVEVAAQKIRQEVDKLYQLGMDVEKTRHISLFALAPIPLLVFLGRCLSNKITVDLFQRHRDAGSPWTWRASGEPAEFVRNVRQRGTDPTRVAVLLSLSGPLHLIDLPSAIDGTFTVYEITLANGKPTVDFLRQRQDLERFRRAYREFLDALMANHPGIQDLHVFPAVPAPVAVACGHDLLPKVHPALLVHDRDKAKGGFTLRMRVNDKDAP